MVKLTSKFAALSLAVITPIISAVDIRLCDDAYYVNCDWKYDVPTGKCLNTTASDGWTGFTDNAVSSYNQTNTGSCGVCYYYADDDCFDLLFSSGDASLNWFAGYNDQLSSIFCSESA
ncbi:uncharacterized protein EV420DRAFT_1569297 [Desarmillaria tabescens]|uniref:Uncharacterized protein n=1 Tax=Armillaria tabescens TaxID=1929756 RepID=A0AA39JQD8_ARMTA|nr:uncharacterized protein EV420DRAFT_1569297 [Desarmillaria tabescens]KAK0446995.1 hypothetical protein EV420DRAFT_1569297 [Desarmillaria tabescens]